MMRKLKLMAMFLLLAVFFTTGCSSEAEQMTGEPDSAAMAQATEEMMDDEEAMVEGTATPMVEDTAEAPMAGEEEQMAESTEESMAEDAMTQEPMAEATEETMDESEGEGEMMEPEMGVLSLELAGLEDLGQGWAYEGWIIVDGMPLSTGTFTVDEEGMASAHDFEIDAGQLAAAELFVLTIEPVPDPDPAPSQVHYLAGAFQDDVADLSIAHPAALGTDFSGAQGSSYILGIPSSDMSDDSYTSGIWFDNLRLPQLPDGWVYEGWVVGINGPVSTGRFQNPSEIDSDGAGPTAGPNPGPDYPGQDFLNPPIYLTDGYAVVISVEPEPDNSPAPFTLKPLVDMTVEDVGDHNSQELAYSSDSFPTGIAHRGMMN